MKSAKKSNPYRGLIIITLIIAFVIALMYAGITGINAYRNTQLKRQTEEVEARNRDIEMAYQIAKAEYELATQTGHSQAWPQPPQDELCVVNLSTYPLENTYDTLVTRQELMEGGLILVNHWHPLPSDAQDDRETIKSVRDWTNGRVPLSSNNVRLLKAPADAVDGMLIDATLIGLEHFIMQAAFRTYENQQAFFDERVSLLSSRYEGEALTREAIKYVNYPGTSEYQTGLSFEMKLYQRGDTTVTNSKFQETEQGKWFTENAWKYGLIFRFPTAGFPNENTEDKTYKTGVSATLNIYRYVGVAHATAMRILNMCLEEYIEYLIANPHLAIYENGVLKYEIYRQPYSGGDATVQVPRASSGSVSSMDNMGGVVSAFYYQ